MKKSDFDPSAKYRFTRPMLWSGKYVSTGDPVPDDGTPIGILRSLYKLRHIELIDDGSVNNHSNDNIVVTVEQPVVEQPVVEQPVVEQPVVEQPVVEQPVVAAQAEIRNEGSGWYNVYVSGMLMTEKKMRKEEAIEWCNEKGLTYNYS